MPSQRDAEALVRRTGRLQVMLCAMCGKEHEKLAGPGQRPGGLGPLPSAAAAAAQSAGGSSQEGSPPPPVQPSEACIAALNQLSSKITGFMSKYMKGAEGLVAYLASKKPDIEERLLHMVKVRLCS